MQINVQQSRVTTDNVMKLIQQDHTDIIFVKTIHTPTQSSSNNKNPQDIHIHRRQKQGGYHNRQRQYRRSTF
jgi:hypothetical protein